MIKAGIEDIEKAVQTAYLCNCVPQTTVYPLRTVQERREGLEKIKSQKQQYQNDRLFSIYSENKWIGWCSLFVNEEECYLKIDGIYTLNNLSYDPSEILEYVNSHYKGYMCDVGMMIENEHFQECFLKNGYQIMDKCIDFRGKLSEQDKEDEIKILDEKDFELYAKLHDAENEGMYWTSRRIKEQLDRFIILVHEEKGEITDSMLLMKEPQNQIEVMAANYHSKEMLEKLIRACAYYTQDFEEVIYFANADSLEQECIMAAGLCQYSSYVSLRKIL